MSKTKQVIITVVCAFIILTLAGIAYYLTNGFKSTPQTFYVEYDGSRLTDNTSIALPNGKDLRFDCNNLVGGAADFSVAVEPYHSGKNNFEFSVDERLYIFSGIKANFSAAFIVKKHDGYFTIDTLNNMPEILKTAYPNAEITVPDLDFAATEYFALVITPASGAAITIPFRCSYGIRVQGIMIDKEEILL